VTEDYQKECDPENIYLLDSNHYDGTGKTKIKKEYWCKNHLDTYLNDFKYDQNITFTFRLLVILFMPLFYIVLFVPPIGEMSLTSALVFIAKMLVFFISLILLGFLTEVLNEPIKKYRSKRTYKKITGEKMNEF
jgi:hypothetical protein